MQRCEEREEEIQEERWADHPKHPKRQRRGDRSLRNRVVKHGVITHAISQNHPRQPSCGWGCFTSNLEVISICLPQLRGKDVPFFVVHQAGFVSVVPLKKRVNPVVCDLRGIDLIDVQLCKPSIFSGNPSVSVVQYTPPIPHAISRSTSL